MNFTTSANNSASDGDEVEMDETYSEHERSKSPIDHKRLPKNKSFENSYC